MLAQEEQDRTKLSTPTRPSKHQGHLPSKHSWLIINTDGGFVTHFHGRMQSGCIVLFIISSVLLHRILGYCTTNFHIVFFAVNKWPKWTFYFILSIIFHLSRC